MVQPAKEEDEASGDHSGRRSTTTEGCVFALAGGGREGGEGLDESRRRGFEDGELNFTLYGVLVHAGWSTHSVHYYCFVRTSSGIWYSLDDNREVVPSQIGLGGLRTTLELSTILTHKKEYVPSKTAFAAIMKDPAYAVLNDMWLSLGNQLSGARLVGEGLHARFRAAYPDVEIQPPSPPRNSAMEVDPAKNPFGADAKSSEFPQSPNPQSAYASQEKTGAQDVEMAA